MLEQNINALLDHAEPNRSKAYMLYKTCQNEGLWQGEYSEFETQLQSFYAKHRSKRRKSHFDQFLRKPMDHDIYKNFHLNFRTAGISDKAICDLADWTYNMIRIGTKIKSAMTSKPVLIATLQKITTPGPFEKAEDIEFDDFCTAWEKSVFKSFGQSFKSEMGALVSEFKVMNEQLKLQKNITPQILPAEKLDQVELDWVLAVRTSAENYDLAPDNLVQANVGLKEVERLLSLYRIVQSTKLGELRAHREKIRLTLIDRCDHLLRKYIDQVS